MDYFVLKRDQRVLVGGGLDPGKDGKGESFGVGRERDLEKAGWGIGRRSRICVLNGDPGKVSGGADQLADDDVIVGRVN